MVDTITFSMLLAAIFIFHSIEECLAAKRQGVVPVIVHIAKFQNPAVYYYATILLSCAVVAILLASVIEHSLWMHQAVEIIFIGLFLNALHHLLRSLIAMKILPGTWSALLVIVPFSLYVLCSEHYQLFFEIKDHWQLIPMALAIMFGSIMLSLGVAVVASRY